MANFETVLERFLPVCNSNVAFFIESTLDFLDLYGLACSTKQYHQQSSNLVAWYRILLQKSDVKVTRLNDIARVILAAPFLATRKSWSTWDNQIAGFEYIKRHGVALKQAVEECGITPDDTHLFTKVLLRLDTHNSQLTQEEFEEMLDHECGYSIFRFCAVPLIPVDGDVIQTIANGKHTQVLLSMLRNQYKAFDIGTNPNRRQLELWIVKAPEDQVQQLGLIYLEHQNRLDFEVFVQVLFDIWQTTSDQVCKDRIIKVMENCNKKFMSMNCGLVKRLINNNEIVFLESYLDCFTKLPYTMIWETKDYWTDLNKRPALSILYRKYADQDMSSAKFVFLYMLESYDFSYAQDIINMIVTPVESYSPLNDVVYKMRDLLSNIHV